MAITGNTNDLINLFLICASLELPIKLNNVEARMILYGLKSSPDTVSQIKDHFLPILIDEEM